MEEGVGSREQGGGSLCDTGSSLCRFWEFLPKPRLCFKHIFPHKISVISKICPHKALCKHEIQFLGFISQTMHFRL